MEAEPNDETGESAKHGSPEPASEAPQSKLRDLRPEKDPMGAARRRRPKTGLKNS